MNKDEAIQLVRKYRSMYSKTKIFGSVAHGDKDGYSDRDIVMVRDTELFFPERAKKFISLLKEAGGADLFIYTPKEFRRQLERNVFVDQVVKEM